MEIACSTQNSSQLALLPLLSQLPLSQAGSSYSSAGVQQFSQMSGEMRRKMLSEIAINDPAAFAKLENLLMLMGKAGCVSSSATWLE